MIRHHLKRVNFHLITLYNTLKDLLQSFSNTTLQDQLPVLRSPNEVILRSYTACLVRLTEPIYPILTALFAFGESPLPSPQRAGGVSTGGPL